MTIIKEKGLWKLDNIYTADEKGEELFRNFKYMNDIPDNTDNPQTNDLDKPYLLMIAIISAVLILPAIFLKRKTRLY